MQELKMPIFLMNILVVLFSLIACEAFGTVEIQKRLEKSEIKIISYLLATPKGHLESARGHSYLRFSFSESLSNDDLIMDSGVNNFEPGLFEYTKGLTSSTMKSEIKLIPYWSVKQEYTVNQDRSLFSYILKLSSAQKEQIINTANDLLNSKEQKSYNFLFANCATLVSDILESAGVYTDEDLLGYSRNIPEWIPVVLRKKGLIERVLIDDSTSKKKSIAENLLLEKLRSQDKEFVTKILPFIRSDRAELRIFSLATILLKFQNLENGDRGFGKDFMKRFYSLFMLETNYIRSVLHPLTSSQNLATSNIQVSDLHESPLNFERIPNEPTALESYDVECDEKMCFLSLRISGLNTRGTVKILINELTVKDQIVYFEDKMVGIVNSGDSTILDVRTWLLGITPVATVLDSKDGPLLQFGLIFEDFHLGQFDERIAFRNNIEPFPLCASYVRLMQLAATNAVFDPVAAPLSPNENLQILLSLNHGDIVVVPGFPDLFSWTSKMDSRAVANVLSHSSEAKSELNGISQSFQYLFSENKIELRDAKLIKNLLRLGIALPIYFFARGNQRHAFLVTSLLENPNDQTILLSGYDPNKGFLKNLAKLRIKDMALLAVNYGNDGVVESGITILPLDRKQIALAMEVTRGVSKQLILEQSNRHKHFTYNLNQLNAVIR